MAQLIVRNLEEDIVNELKRRAGENGRSAEAEHREILREALLGPQGRLRKAILLEMPNVGNDTDFERAPGFPRDIEL